MSLITSRLFPRHFACRISSSSSKSSTSPSDSVPSAPSSTDEPAASPLEFPLFSRVSAHFVSLSAVPISVAPSTAGVDLLLTREVSIDGEVFEALSQISAFLDTSPTCSGSSLVTHSKRMTGNSCTANRKALAEITSLL